MKFTTLPAKTQKDEPNVVEITNRKIDPEAKDGTKFEIPADKFEYPQIESREEFTTLCGTAERELDVLNEYLRDKSVTEGKNRIRTATSGTHDEIIQAGINATKNFTFVESVALTGAAAKETLSTLKDMVNAKTMTDEEIAAAVRKMLGA